MYPLTSLHFQVDWGDATTNFSEVSGLVVEAEAIEYRGGADPAPFVSKLPGLRKAGNVTLKRGVMPAVAGNGLYAWYDSIQANQVERRSVTITLLNEERVPAMTWKLREAWPVKLEGPGLNATGNEVAIETVELACERIEIEAGG
jgi:phage tail-like protein